MRVLGLITAAAACLPLALAAGASPIRRNGPAWNQLQGYSFSAFVRDFAKPYKIGSEEYAARQKIFLGELQRVQEHNARGLSWREGINERSDMTAEEKHQTLGLMRTSAAHMQRSHNPKHAENAPDFPTKPPKAIDWRDYNIIDGVSNQGFCGSCWAFASVSVLSAHAAKSTGLLADLSPQQLVSCAPNPNSCGGTGGCSGATYDVAFDYIIDHGGIYLEDQYPYTEEYNGLLNTSEAACNYPPTCNASLCQPQVTMDSYVVLTPNNYDDMYNALGTIGPLGVSVDASNWSAYEGGVFTGCSSDPDAPVIINHAVTAVGYGKDSESGLDYWLIKNSWGPVWGEAGYIRLFREPSADEMICGTDPDPKDGDGCADDDGAPLQVCGECGVLSSSAYPTGVQFFGNAFYFDQSKSNSKNNDDDSNDKALTEGLIAVSSLSVLLGGALIYIFMKFELRRKSTGGDNGNLNDGLLDTA